MSLAPSPVPATDEPVVTPSPTHQTAPISAFREHPAQMRTLYDTDEMATLTLQVHVRDLDTWQPIVATPTLEGDGYFIISGHRRRMARLFADGLAAQQTGEEVVTIETVRDYLQTLVEVHGFLDVAAEALAAEAPDRPLPFVLFEGEEKAQILALQRANYGVATPDRLGIAHSFQQALEAGTSVEEVARNAGQHVAYVTNHLALMQVPQELAELVADGQLPLSVAVAVAGVKEEAKHIGLALFVLSCAPTYPTAAVVQQVARTLKRWTGLQLPLETSSQSEHNLARCLVRLWQQAVSAYPAQTWASAARLMARGIEVERPWEHRSTTYAWLEALGGERYSDPESGIRWETVVEALLVEVSCEHCPLAQLPERLLRADLAGYHPGVLGRPCRTVARQAATRCLNGFAPQDPVRVEVPWSWADHPGVARDGRRYVVGSFEALELAWQAQAECEGEVADAEPGMSMEALAATIQPQRSPIQRMRARIADYMQRHRDLDTAHPYATPCDRCQHKLAGSPTQNPNVPHCAWAARLRNVSFHALATEEGGTTQRLVPVCRQFAPQEGWRKLIPELAEDAALPPGTSRAWLHQQILALARDASDASYNREPFEHLTGRPMSSSERYADWFASQLEAQIGELSDGQLWTLFLWALAEWQRHKQHRGPFELPGAGGQLIPMSEVAWPDPPPPQEAPEEGGALLSD